MYTSGGMSKPQVAIGDTLVQGVFERCDRREFASRLPQCKP